MIEFLLTNWWIYIPIITVLLFFTARNNQKLKYIKQERAVREADPDVRQQKIDELKRKPSLFDSIISKLGLRGILNYIFPKK